MPVAKHCHRAQRGVWRPYLVLRVRPKLSLDSRGNAAGGRANEVIWQRGPVRLPTRACPVIRRPLFYGTHGVARPTPPKN